MNDRLNRRHDLDQRNSHLSKNLLNRRNLLLIKYWLDQAVTYVENVKLK